MNEKIEEVKQTLRQLGTRAKVQLGQHFLLNTAVLDRMLEGSQLQPTDRIVEIGPGLGVLTERLLAEAGEVVAVEQDPLLVDYLQSHLPMEEGKLRLVRGDALREIPLLVQGWGAYKVVANIPYQITTPLLRLFLEQLEQRPLSLTLLIQKEVAQRIAAPAASGERGYLSVLCQYYAEVEYLLTVGAEQFWPVPKVNSAVVHLKLKEQRCYQDDREEEGKFLRFVHQYFIQPRKQLLNVVAGMRGISKLASRQLLEELGLPATVRAQELSLEQWQKFYQRLQV